MWATNDDIRSEVVVVGIEVVVDEDQACVVVDEGPVSDLDRLRYAIARAHHRVRTVAVVDHADHAASGEGINDADIVGRVSPDVRDVTGRFLVRQVEYTAERHVDRFTGP